MKTALICIIIAFVLPFVRAGEDNALAKKELEPRLVSLPKGNQSLSAILELLHKETGNLVVDRRRTATDLKLDFESGKATFWKAVGAIARRAGCQVALYQPDGKIALIDGTSKSVPTDFTGIFRVTAKRVDLSRNIEAGTHSCVVALDVAWEPRFEPFYLDIGTVEVVYAPAAPAREAPRIEKAPSRGQLAVSGRAAAEVEVRLPAPDRKSAEIQSVRGTLRAIGPSKMLDFTFDKLEPIKKADERRSHSQDGVKVTLAGLKTNSERWTVDVLIENPPGGPVFESFQSWLDNNRIALVRGKERWVPEPDAEEQLEALTAGRALIRHYFTTKGRKTDLSGWTLHYRTPGRIVEVTAPFALKNLPLP